MAEIYSFFDPVETSPDVFDREYNAQEFTDYFASLVTTGVMKGAGAELKVTANGSNMLTEIDTGIAFLEGKRYANTTKLAHTLDTETLGKKRIDRIVVRLDLNTEARYVKSFIKKGVASASPVPPALQRDGGVYEISLALIKVIGGQTYINVADVTDERGMDDICPWAGSNILPNFNEEGLQDLIDSVDNHVYDPMKHVYFGKAVQTSGNDYAVTIDGITKYEEGMAITIIPDTTNTGSAYININGLGRVRLMNQASAFINAGMFKASFPYMFVYNGGMFVLQGGAVEPVETVFNTNGEYFKFPDGVLICFHRMQAKYKRTQNLEATWSYPHTFTSVPRVFISLDWGDSSIAVAEKMAQVGYMNASTTFVQPVVYSFSGGFSSNVFAWVSVMAIGRWK